MGFFDTNSRDRKQEVFLRQIARLGKAGREKPFCLLLLVSSFFFKRLYGAILPSAKIESRHRSILDLIMYCMYILIDDHVSERPASRLKEE